MSGTGNLVDVRRELTAVFAVIGLVLLNAGCGEPSPGGSETPPPTSPTSTANPTSTASPTSTDTASPTSSVSWAMPNLVGRNLQAAQDAMQELTNNPIFFTSSTDATGQGRSQVVDSNWIVCSQNVRPGEPITAETRIELAAVKLDERCP
jgi:hypothetical protein